MAIQIDLQESNFGIPFAQAYFRIANVAINYKSNLDFHHLVMITLIGYATKPESVHINNIDSKHYDVPLIEIESCDGATFLEKCYKWVMAQSDMSNSIAV
jgi:hypothetical protein